MTQSGSLADQIKHQLGNPDRRVIDRPPTDLEKEAAKLRVILTRKREELGLDSLIASISEATGKTAQYDEGVNQRHHVLSHVFNRWEFLVDERVEGDYRRTYTVELSLEVDKMGIARVWLWGPGITLDPSLMRSPGITSVVARAFLNPHCKKEIRVSWDKYPQDYERMD